MKVCGNCPPREDVLVRIAALMDFAKDCPDLEQRVPQSEGANARVAFDQMLTLNVRRLQAMHASSGERW